MKIIRIHVTGSVQTHEIVPTKKDPSKMRKKRLAVPLIQMEIEIDPEFPVVLRSAYRDNNGVIYLCTQAGNMPGVPSVLRNAVWYLPGYTTPTKLHFIGLSQPEEANSLPNTAQL